MSGTKEGAVKRLATMKRNADKANVDITSIYAEWGRKGSKTTTGGFQNMSKDKLKKASRAGVEARMKRRQVNNKGVKNV